MAIPAVTTTRPVVALPISAVPRVKSAAGGFAKSVAPTPTAPPNTAATVPAPTVASTPTAPALKAACIVFATPVTGTAPPVVIAASVVRASAITAPVTAIENGESRLLGR